MENTTNVEHASKSKRIKGSASSSALEQAQVGPSKDEQGNPREIHPGYNRNLSALEKANKEAMKKYKKAQQEVYK